MQHRGMDKPIIVLVCAMLLVAAAAPTPATAAMPMVDRFDAYKPDALLTVTGGALTTKKENGETVYRWQINAGESSALSLRQDSPVFDRLRYFDRLHVEFRVVSGEVSNIGARAMGHVSGVRQAKAFSWNLANRTVEHNVWHIREIELASPYWLPWDNADGEGDQGYFRLESLALSPDTVVELRNLRFSRDLVALKPDSELPITWPVKTVNADGSVTYSITYQVHNASGKPTDIVAAVASPHKHFTVSLDKPRQPVKAFAIATFTLTATIGKADIDRTPELYAEPLRVAFCPAHAPDSTCLWQGTLVRPLSPGFRRQVVVAPNDLAMIRQGVQDDNAEIKRTVNYAQVIKSADEFLGRQLGGLPMGNLHVANGYPGDWRPGDYMPEIVNLKTGERETGTWLASRVWKEYLGGTGHACESLGMAYLMTGDEKYAQKAISLFKVYARQYMEQPLSVQNDAPWRRGTPIQNSSRLAWNTSYGSNWYCKGHCRLLSMIADSPSWKPEDRRKVYESFILPYATELLRLAAAISNQNDITNHNTLLLGLVFDDALLVRTALLSDAGMISRLSDIEPDGFSGEGRPLNYHYAEMAEYLPTIAYLENSGVNVPYQKQRVLAALRMPYLRATLAGRVPNAGDSGFGASVGNQGLADYLVPAFPKERWLYDIGGTSTLAKKLLVVKTGDRPNPAAWRNLLSAEPKLFADAGVAILRHGEAAETQVMATLDYGRSVFHSALDRNQITLSAFGKTFTHGPGSLYNAGSGRNVGPDKRLSTFINGGSLANNIIIVDSKNQRTAIGDLVAWTPTPEFQAAVARVNGIQPGVVHTRGLVLTKGLLVVLDRVESQDAHTYDFVYHNLGTLTLGDGWRATAMDGPLAATGNYDNIVDPKRLTGAGNLRLTWDLSAQTMPAEKKRPGEANQPPKPVKLHLWQLPLPNGEAFTGGTGMNNPNTNTLYDLAPSLFRRVTGKNAAFVTVLEPVSGENARVTGIEAAANAGVKISLADGTTISVSLDELLTKYPARKTP